MTVLGIDLGTTRTKVARFDSAGTLEHLATHPMGTYRGTDGETYHDPEKLWRSVLQLLQEVSSAGSTTVLAVGVTSMAEAGLLVDRRTGSPRTPIIPWYDQRATGQSAQVLDAETASEAHQRTGLHPSFKFALPKLLWLREHEGNVLDGAVWLSVADYVVFRLTDSMGTDPTLAVRTYLYDLPAGRWSTRALRAHDLPDDIVPAVSAAGQPIGGVTGNAVQPHLPAGTPVAVCGHDHLCAAFGAGVQRPGALLDSIGTAESLVGILNDGSHPEDAYEAGLAICPTLVPGQRAWLGGVRSSGGSVEWLRSVMDDPPLPYQDLMRLATEVGPDPTGILYLPYLWGAPLGGGGDASFVGITGRHGRGHLIRAVLEGTAFEAERLRHAADGFASVECSEMVAVGGGVHNTAWMQIKADVSGRRYRVPGVPEAAALGAALCAGLGSGALRESDTQHIISRNSARGRSIEPDVGRHLRYRNLYEQYRAMGDALRTRARAVERTTA